MLRISILALSLSLSFTRLSGIAGETTWPLFHWLRIFSHGKGRTTAESGEQNRQMPMILLYACLAQHCACCLHLGYVWVLIDPLRRDVEENARAMNDCQLGRIELREAPESYVPFSIWISFSFPRKEFSRHGFTFLILPRSLKTQVWQAICCAEMRHSNRNPLSAETN